MDSLKNSTDFFRNSLGFLKNPDRRKGAFAPPWMKSRVSHGLLEILAINGASTMMMLADGNNGLLVRRQMRRETAYQ